MAARQIVRLLAVVTFLATAGTAFKADAQNWDGSGLIRFGVFLQGSFIDYDITQTPTGAAAFRQSAAPDGIGVGIASGYDLRLGSFVVGAEADVSFDDGRSLAKPTTSEKYGIDYFATMRGRLGYLVHQNVMLYGTLGYALLGAEYKREGFTLPGATGTTTGAKKYGTLDGFVYGAGMEWDMGWGISFLEYLHTDIGGWTFRSFGTNNRVALDGTSDVVRFGLKFKVGHDYSHDVYRRPEPLK